MGKDAATNSSPQETDADGSATRIQRAPNLVTQVERYLREAIRDGGFPDRKLPTEVKLAEQLGVSRETVRRATESLAAEGLLVKFRRKGTFLAAPDTELPLARAKATAIGYIQADYRLPGGDAEPTTRYIGAQMLDGALDAASAADSELVVLRLTIGDLAKGVRRLTQSARLCGVVFASVGEEKLLRRMTGLGLPMVLMDHDAHLPEISTIRDDSADGARLAVEHLADQSHRHIAIAYWQQTDLNPWRLEGFRQALRERGLPRRRKWEFLTDLSLAGARQVAEELAAMNPRPTAIYCFNNSMARMVIAELAELGIAVPRDISVVGGGGEVVAGLTHHQANWYAIGRRGIETLLNAVNQPDRQQPVHHLELHALVEGTTTCPINT